MGAVRLSLRPRLHPLAWFVLGVIALPFAVQALGSTIGLATEILVTILFALAFNFLLGYTGRLSFGHAAYFGLGAYAAALLQLKLWPSTLGPILLAPLVSAAVAAIVGGLIVRTRGIYFSLLTLAFAQVVYFIVFEWRDFTGGEFGVGGITRIAPFGLSIDSDLSYYIFVAAIVVPAVYVLWRIVDSPFGRVLKAIRNNDQRAACLGYNTRLYTFVSFVISGAFAGLAGALSAFTIRYISPDLLHWSASGTVVMMTLIGGTQAFFGPAIGAFIFVLAKDVLSSYTEHWMIPLGVIFVLFVLLAPEGIGGLARQMFARLPLTAVAGRPGDEDFESSEPDSRAEPLPSPLAADAGAQPSAEPVLSAEGLVKRFGAFAAVNGASLDVCRGEIHAIIGPNGAGKTTLFNLLTGILPADEGRVILAGRDVSRSPAYARIGAGLARSFQIISVFKELTALENVRISAQARSRHRFDFFRHADTLVPLRKEALVLLATVGLAGHEGRVASTLGHGERRLLEIAIALATRPAVLLLDEPLAGLPDAERARIAALIQRLAQTYAVLLIEHDIDRVLEISHRLTVLHEGRVIATGKPAEVQATAIVQQAYLGRTDTMEAAPRITARPARTGAPLLQLDKINTFYGTSQVLHDVSLTVRENEMACLLGRNGAGKTTTLRSIIGATAPRSGRIVIGGAEVQREPSHRVARLGLAIVPEGARVFPNLTVTEHMLMAVHHGRSGPWTIPRVLDLLPKLGVLRDRTAEHLSGGERKMLALARGLLANPRLLLLDEPLEGLAPGVADSILHVLNAMRGEMAILLVEQKASLVLPLCESAFIMNNGTVVYSGRSRDLLEDDEKLQRLLGV
jgi:branched-chain amino acid transport system ATP-binding protein